MLIIQKQIVGIAVFVFIKKSIANRLNNLDFDIIKLGVGGNFGNKGAVLIRLNIDNSSLCFINCHLESG